MAKDVKIAADLAKQIGIDSPLVGCRSALWDDARDPLGSDKDHTLGVSIGKSAPRKPPPDDVAS